LILLVLPLLPLSSVAATGPDCKAIDAAASAKAAVIPGDQSGRDVVGKGRAQFYSAPDRRCPVMGVFLVPRDSVNAYSDVDGFTFVMYLNPRTGEDTEGWIESKRLRVNGYGISPPQQ